MHLDGTLLALHRLLYKSKPKLTGNSDDKEEDESLFLSSTPAEDNDEDRQCRQRQGQRLWTLWVFILSELTDRRAEPRGH